MDHDQSLDWLRPVAASPGKCTTVNSGPCVACDEETPADRLPYPGRTRIERPDGTPVFLCDDCRTSVEAGEFGAFSDGALLHLRAWAPLFGIDIDAGPAEPFAKVSHR
jgi:hypothetical protein